MADERPHIRSLSRDAFKALLEPRLTRLLLREMANPFWRSTTGSAWFFYARDLYLGDYRGSPLQEVHVDALVVTGVSRIVFERRRRDEYGRCSNGFLMVT